MSLSSLLPYWFRLVLSEVVSSTVNLTRLGPTWDVYRLTPLRVVRPFGRLCTYPVYPVVVRSQSWRSLNRVNLVSCVSPFFTPTFPVHSFPKHRILLYKWNRRSSIPPCFSITRPFATPVSWFGVPSDSHSFVVTVRVVHYPRTWSRRKLHPL